MPKMKTKSGAKKRFKVTASGRVKVKGAYMRHMQTNKPKSMKRKARGTQTLCDVDARIVLRSFLPGAKRGRRATTKKKEQADG